MTRMGNKLTYHSRLFALTLFGALLWLYALSRFNPQHLLPYGLLSSMGPAYPIALIVLTLVFLLSLDTPSTSPAIIAGSLLFAALFATPILVEGTPRFAFVFNPYGYSRHLLDVHHISFAYTYDNWPLLLTLEAAFQRVAGLDPVSLFLWAPLILSAFGLLGLYLLSRNFFTPQISLIVCLVFAYLGSGPGYLLPATIGGLFYLAVTILWVHVYRKRISWLALLPFLIALPVTHFLTALVTVAFLWIFALWNLIFGFPKRQAIQSFKAGSLGLFLLALISLWQFTYARGWTITTGEATIWGLGCLVGLCPAQSSQAQVAQSSQAQVAQSSQAQVAQSSQAQVAQSSQAQVAQSSQSQTTHHLDVASHLEHLLPPSLRGELGPVIQLGFSGTLAHVVVVALRFAAVGLLILLALLALFKAPSEGIAYALIGLLAAVSTAAAGSYGGELLSRMYGFGEGFFALLAGALLGRTKKIAWLLLLFAALLYPFLAYGEERAFYIYPSEISAVRLFNAYAPQTAFQLKYPVQRAWGLASFEAQGYGAGGPNVFLASGLADTQMLSYYGWTSDIGKGIDQILENPSTQLQWAPSRFTKR
jgi:hypothetical protein